ncbi:MAG TPA: MFS transporter [Verrucomicrobia bacterium]|nr:MFS transporter [Verrucomicrobiales bacterium]HIL53520.1 MFS transporter [Verrucomicrobiota bacterium]
MTDSADNKPNKALFWGCFIALVTTSFGFITRIFMLSDSTISTDLLALDAGEVGQYIGIQIWPFAISIIGFSLIIDKVGYKFSMIFAFACQIIWTVMGYLAISSDSMDVETRKQLIYWGGFILALGNGTVEAFINPVVATMFTKAKTKWLNILHAGWPGGLVVAGVLVIFMEKSPWEQKLLLIAIPAVIYFIMLIKQTFPVQERVSAGISYKGMLSEFGFLGGLVAAFVIFLQLDDSLNVNSIVLMVICGGMAVGLGLYTGSLGRPLMFVLLLIMMPLATTEIGTDAWISGIMENAVEKIHPGWILVYTSVIMMVLRFLAGPITHRLQPIPILIISSVLAIAGLASLSGAAGAAIIFVAATLYALGKTFFWPTMLGVVSEQTPKGGALTLNAVSGVGMLAVGVLGTPYIGALQEKKIVSEVAIIQEAAAVPGLIEDGSVSESVLKQQDKLYGTIKYPVLQMDAVNELIKKAPEGEQEEITKAITVAKNGSGQKALKNMTVFPFVMLIAYILMFLYFRSKGGYKPLELSADGGSSSDG